VTRKAVAERVYNEWTPVSGERGRKYQISSLATLFKAEIRITGRSELLDLNIALKGINNLLKLWSIFAMDHQVWQQVRCSE